MSRLTERQCHRRRDEIYDRLGRLPQGTVKKRIISGRTYYYLQRREGKKVIHQYLGREISAEFKAQLNERAALRQELESIDQKLRAFIVKALKNRW